MKTSIFLFLLTLLSVTANSQIKLQMQAGGSNFLGMSVNISKEFDLGTKTNLSLEPDLGFGLLLPGWDIPTNIIHSGVNLNWKQFGIGTEGSWFIKSPFVKQETLAAPDTRLIIYPDINYTIGFAKNWFFKVSAGAFFAFADRHHFYNDHALFFENDVIPGAGLSFGYIFRTKNNRIISRKI